MATTNISLGVYAIINRLPLDYTPVGGGATVIAYSPGANTTYNCVSGSDCISLFGKLAYKGAAIDHICLVFFDADRGAFHVTPTIIWNVAYTTVGALMYFALALTSYAYVRVEEEEAVLLQSPS